VVFACVPLTLQELSESLKIRTDEGLDVYDLDVLIKYRYGSFFSISSNSRQVSEGYRITLSLDGQPSSSTTSSRAPRYDNPKDPEICFDFTNDEESNTIPESEFSKYYVHLSHASIGDFFNSLEQQADLGFQIHRKEAHLQMLTACFRMYCDSSVYETCKDGIAAQYGIYVFNHFLAIIEDLGKDEKIMVAEQLIQMFEDESIATRWVIPYIPHLVQVFFVQTWSKAKLAKFFQDEDVLQHFDPDSKEGQWIRNTAVSPIGFQLKQLAQVCATQWLKGDREILDTHPQEEIIFLHNYLLRVSNYFFSCSF